MNLSEGVWWIALHNLSDTEEDVTLDPHYQRGRHMQSLLDEPGREVSIEGAHTETLEPYDYRWCRVVGERF